ncbi:hypothetical protein SteCoe_13374 [Stentor coeruleus]|uniref:Uncharacterized protein n=1 Tax=Stentor coeruleus TaxID=5963 RepID=A0A1R2C8L1_9CILI|nr:hypothetical protein SteCoe_13374 [Stentor coeruleus]
MLEEDDFALILDFVNPSTNIKGINFLPVQNPQIILKNLTSIIDEKYWTSDLMIYFLRVFSQTFTQTFEYTDISDEIFCLLENFIEKNTDDKLFCVLILIAAFHDKESFAKNIHFKNPEKIVLDFGTNLLGIKDFLNDRSADYAFFIACATYNCSEKSNIDRKIVLLPSINADENTKKSCLGSFLDV